MSSIPGTSCLLTDLDDLFVAAPPARTRRRTSLSTALTDPGDDHARAASMATVGRPATLCSSCGVPVGEGFTRRAASGKAFCLICADQAVEAYYRRHPEKRPAPERIARERTGTSYMQERERYEARHHAGNGRWQISDTQARRWTAYAGQTEEAAQAAARSMNDAWGAQLAQERERFGSHAVPSTAPMHTRLVGDATYAADPA